MPSSSTGMSPVAPPMVVTVRPLLDVAFIVARWMSVKRLS